MRTSRYINDINALKLETAVSVKDRMVRFSSEIFSLRKLAHRRRTGWKPALYFL